MAGQTIGDCRLQDVLVVIVVNLAVGAHPHHVVR